MFDLPDSKFRQVNGKFVSPGSVQIKLVFVIKVASGRVRKITERESQINVPSRFCFQTIAVTGHQEALQLVDSIISKVRSMPAKAAWIFGWWIPCKSVNKRF